MGRAARPALELLFTVLTFIWFVVPTTQITSSEINGKNYRKGLATKRIGFLLGNGLTVSRGIQPAFHDEAIGTLMNVIATINVALLKKWKHAAQEKENVNITNDISHMS